jgi:bifunctional non-homologous end joining protein LigD
MSLREYIRKRDFTRTREPEGGKKSGRGKALRFVIQKHAASRLHYDFRLELGSVLKSWAVPKGIPLKQGEKRLAVEVEDHPLGYANFEGIIPKGDYGGGTVMLWDTGKYISLGGDPAHDLKKGKLHFALKGRKLAGEWTLVRFKHGGDNQWLLMKSGSDAKPVSKKRDDESALSKRSMERIAKDGDAKWHSGHAEKTPPALKFVEPMKAKFVATPPRGKEWIYELKFDGYRAIAIKNGSKVELLSRSNKDLSARFPDVIDSVASLKPDGLMLDGEIVALDEEGRSSFQLLQGLEMGTVRPPIIYYVFDVLYENGESLQDLPFTKRRARLQKILGAKGRGLIRISGEIHGDPHRLLEETGKHGLEGIVGKKSDSIYEAGRRSGAWIKLKSVNEQEFVIGGWTPPKGTRSHFGALLIGYFAKGNLHFAGKVGTGFDGTSLASLFKTLKPLQQPVSPFTNLPEKTPGRWGGNITPAEMKRCKWVKPELVCQIKFAEWTRDGKLRQPVFLGLRDDKAAHKVVRERPA